MNYVLEVQEYSIVLAINLYKCIVRILSESAVSCPNSQWIMTIKCVNRPIYFCNTNKCNGAGHLKGISFLFIQSFISQRFYQNDENFFCNDSVVNRLKEIFYDAFKFYYPTCKTGAW